MLGRVDIAQACPRITPEVQGQCGPRRVRRREESEDDERSQQQDAGKTHLIRPARVSIIGRYHAWFPVLTTKALTR